MAISKAAEKVTTPKTGARRDTDWCFVSLSRPENTLSASCEKVPQMRLRMAYEHNNKKVTTWLDERYTDIPIDTNLKKNEIHRGD